MKLSVNFQECDESIGFDFEEKTESFNIGFGDNSNGSSIDNEKVNAIEKKVDILETQVLEVNESVKTAITKAENAEKTANESKFTTDDTLTLKDGILSVNTNVVGGGGGGVTSWDDLRDKPFYEETEIAELVSNLTTEAYDNGQFPPCNFIVGEKYNVIWNGESYNDLICYESDGYRVIGGEGYPFYIDDDGGNSLYIESTTDETDFVVTIIGKRVTIKTIDEKFLPAWDDLKNKPFGETPPLFDITWDGNMEGHEVVDMGDGNYYVKVSDEVFTKEQLLNSTTFNSNSYEVINTEENISIDEEFGAIFLNGGMVIFSAENFNTVAGLPEGTFSNGVWLYNSTGEEPFYVNRLVAATTIKTIDEKYIPDSIARVEDIDKEVSWNDITDKPFGEETQYNLRVTSDVTTTSSVTVPFTAVVGKTYKIDVIDVGSNTVLISSIAVCTTFPTMPNYYVMTGGEIGANSYNNTSWTFTTTAAAGQSKIFKVYEVNTSLITLDEKYIPDTIARASEVPTSYNDLTDVPVKETITTVFTEQSVTVTGTMVWFLNKEIDLSLNLIIFDGQEYSVNGTYYSAFRVYGNGSLVSSTLVDNEMPFALAYDLLNYSLSLYASAGTHTISAYKRDLVFLNEKFLPDVVVLESELEAKGYQTQEQVTELINNALGEIENGTY